MWTSEDHTSGARRADAGTRRRRWSGALALACAAGLAACATGVLPPSQIGLWPDAADGVRSTDLERLVEASWESYLASHPEDATRLGDSRYLDDVQRITRTARDSRRDALWGEIAALEALEPGQLSDEDQLTRAALLEELTRELDALEAGFHEWRVEPFRDDHSEIEALAAIQPIGTAIERDQLVQRWRNHAADLRQQAAALRTGLSRGKVADRRSIQRAIARIDRVLARPLHTDPLVKPAAGNGRWVRLEPGDTLARIAREELGSAADQGVLRKLNARLLDESQRALGTWVLIPDPADRLELEERAAFLTAVLDAVELDVRPALVSYRETLADVLLPDARGDERAGMVWLPDGEELYRERVRQFVDLYQDPERLHEICLDELEGWTRELESLGQRHLNAPDLVALRQRLSQAPEAFFAESANLAGDVAVAVDRAEAKLGMAFDLLPRTALEVLPDTRPTDWDRDRYVPAQLVAPGSARAASSARYVFPVDAALPRLRFEVEVRAYAGAIPGAHLQRALAAERRGLPRFRRHLGSTALEAGWELYTARLADQLGLYSSELDRMGMLSYLVSRAALAVTDTGLHHYGWSRDRALSFLLDRSLLTPSAAEAELDDVIAHPGQALAPVLGQRELFELRARANAVQGKEFRLQAFHDELLRHGSLRLNLLRERVADWAGFLLD
ncbi:MAG: DUF885 domain-containing protein [Planctomycetota bacterium]|jgi:uncharacterized protein (DUF885 family)